MSRPRRCVCCFCCRKRSHPEQRILPPYTQTLQKSPFAFQSHQRQQHTLEKITELVKKREKSRLRAGLANEQEKGRGVSFRSRFIEAMTKKLSAPATGRDRMKNSLDSSQIEDIETDLDKKTQEHVARMKPATVEPATVEPAPQQERFTPAHGRASMEGRLLKFTNLMKGYRPRWFVLNAEEGTLQYFKTKEQKKYKLKGSIHLGAAKVSPTKGDLTFTVSSVSGGIYKLKAHDAREKQLWIERIKATADYHSSKLATTTKCVPPAAMSAMLAACEASTCIHTPKSWKKDGKVRKLEIESLKYAKTNFREAEDYFRHLDSKILELPMTGIYMTSLDADLLLLKAMSVATLQGVHDCISLLQIATMQLEQSTSPRSSVATRLSQFLMPTILDASGWSLPNPADEIPDDGMFEDKDLDKVEDHKTIIVHLLSQLRLGMDLTKVVLPTFVLERRSLLELFTDCMAHPDMFIKITGFRDPETRFLAVMEWYLTSFHSGRLGTSAKKPYNPIIGETFHCSWHVPYTQYHTKDVLLTYTAEQVSHHPPVTAFYVECPEKKMKMNSSIYTKSKFMGMSMGVSLIGKVLLHLAELDEDYVFTLPSAYARSILTVPWVELGDKIQMSCDRTGYVATILFHTKPFYGGKLHHVTAEAKNMNTGQAVCKVVGEWNSCFHFTYPGSGKSSKTVDVSTLKVYLKYVRPLEKQKESESRKLWIHVTEALSNNDMQKATECKQNLESIQREEEERRRELRVEYEAKFFRNVNGVWLYKTLPDNFGAETKK